jgi:hypothetical protein
LLGTSTSEQSTATAVLYNPAANSWTSTGSMPVGRDHQAAVLLPDGQVLVAGGRYTANVGYKYNRLYSAELYTP